MYFNIICITFSKHVITIHGLLFYILPNPKVKELNRSPLIFLGFGQEFTDPTRDSASDVLRSPGALASLLRTLDTWQRGCSWFVFIHSVPCILDFHPCSESQQLYLQHSFVRSSTATTKSSVKTWVTAKIILFWNILFHRNKDVMEKMSASTTAFLLKKLHEIKPMQAGVTHLWATQGDTHQEGSWPEAW